MLAAILPHCLNQSKVIKSLPLPLPLFSSLVQISSHKIKIINHIKALGTTIITKKERIPSETNLIDFHRIQRGVADARSRNRVTMESRFRPELDGRYH